MTFAAMAMDGNATSTVSRIRSSAPGIRGQHAGRAQHLATRAVDRAGARIGHDPEIGSGCNDEPGAGMITAGPNGIVIEELVFGDTGARQVDADFHLPGIFGIDGIRDTVGRQADFELAAVGRESAKAGVE